MTKGLRRRAKKRQMGCCDETGHYNHLLYHYDLNKKPFITQCQQQTKNISLSLRKVSVNIPSRIYEKSVSLSRHFKVWRREP